MRLIIAGGRTLPRGVTEQQVATIIDCFASEHEITQVVCGGASGVDDIGKWWALAKGLKIAMFPADWKTYGKSAGPIRNREMARFGDELLAIWNGTSPGTRNMIQEMTKLGKPVHSAIIGAKPA